MIVYILKLKGLASSANETWTEKINDLNIAL